jgi:putative transposase
MSRITRSVRQSGIYFVTTDTWQRRQIFLKPEPARIVLERILECRDRGFYALHSFVIMPEHLHMLLTPGSETSLEKAVMMIKGGSSHSIKEELLYRFPIWMEGFHDRWIRDRHEYRVRKQYIEQNPVKAGLIEKPEQYELGSRCGKFRLDACTFDEGASGAEALSSIPVGISLVNVRPTKQRQEK